MTLFPELLSWTPLAPFILRVIVGFVFINLGYLKLTQEKSRWINSFSVLRIKPAASFVTLFGLLQIIGGILFVLGLFVQLTALVFSIITFFEIFVEFKEESVFKRGEVFYILLFTISLSLLLLGPGMFSIVLPF